MSLICADGARKTVGAAEIERFASVPFRAKRSAKMWGTDGVVVARRFSKCNRISAYGRLGGSTRSAGSPAFLRAATHFLFTGPPVMCLPFRLDGMKTSH